MKKTAVLLTALILAMCTAVRAQEHKAAYAVAIKLHVGGQAISGYLYSVDDSLITIIAARSRKALRSALVRPQLISIPNSLVKKVAVVRNRSTGRLITAATLLQIGYSLGLGVLIPIQNYGELFLVTLVATTANFVTLDLLYVRRYMPVDPGFTITMQKYCLVKSGIVADGQ